MQVQSASKSWGMNASSINGNVVGVTPDVLGNATEGYIVNVAREEDEEPVKISPSISGKLKPHQVFVLLDVQVFCSFIILVIYYVLVFKVPFSVYFESTMTVMILYAKYIYQKRCPSSCFLFDFYLGSGGASNSR